MHSSVARRIKNSPWTMAAVGALLLFLANIALFEAFFKIPTVAGWDGSSHAAIGYYYATHIFPKTWGWIKVWYSGMPFPQFYPPAFYFMLACVYKIIPVSYFLIFKIFSFILLASVPGLIGWITADLTENPAGSWIAMLTSVLLMSIYNNFGDYGVTIQASINTGLYTQLLSFVFLLLWLRYFLRISTARKNRYLAGLFLFFIFVSNVNMVPTAFIIFVSAFIVRINQARKSGTVRSVFLEHLAMGGLPLLLASFWYVPMLAYYRFVTGTPLKYFFDFSLLTVFTAWLPLVAIYVISLISGRHRKSEGVAILSLSGLLIIAFSLLWPYRLFPSIIVQVPRWIAPFFVICSIPIGYLSATILLRIKSRKWRMILISATVLLLLAIFFIESPSQNRAGFYTTYNEDRVGDIISFLHSQPAGMVNVEVDTTDDEPRSVAINGALGNAGIPTDFTVFRESSINALFAVPIMDSLSNGYEDWDLSSYLVNSYEFQHGAIDDRLRIADYLGIHYFLVRTATFKQELDGSSLVKRIADFGRWSVYALKDTPQNAFIPEYQPVALFSPLSLKQRTADSYDYIRFQEELLFDNKLDITFAAPHTDELDSAQDLNEFGGIVISQYSYNDLNEAYQTIKIYSQSHPVILIASNDKLFQMLEGLHSKNIYAFPRITGADSDPEPLRNELSSIFNLLESVRVPVESGGLNVAATMNDSSISIDLSAAPSAPVPVIVKTSFFPTWQLNDGSGPYLASPDYMLVFLNAKNSVLTFTAGKATQIGYAISLLALCACAFMVLREVLFSRKG
jgi:hypothetical protein